MTSYVNVSGKLSWCKPNALNKFGKWSVTVHPDIKGQQTIDDLKSKGLKNHVKMDDDGKYVSFSRDPSKLIKGQLRTFQPPPVYGPDGKTELTVSVGNGSDGTVRLEVYPFQSPTGGNGIAARWDSAMITNLIPYEGSKDFGDTDVPKVMQEKRAETFWED